MSILVYRISFSSMSHREFPPNGQCSLKMDHNQMRFHFEIEAVTAAAVEFQEGLTILQLKVTEVNVPSILKGSIMHAVYSDRLEYGYACHDPNSIGRMIERLAHEACRECA